MAVLVDEGPPWHLASSCLSLSSIAARRLSSCDRNELLVILYDGVRTSFDEAWYLKATTEAIALPTAATAETLEAEICSMAI